MPLPRPAVQAACRSSVPRLGCRRGPPYPRRLRAQPRTPRPARTPTRPAVTQSLVTRFVIRVSGSWLCVRGALGLLHAGAQFLEPGTRLRVGTAIESLILLVLFECGARLREVEIEQHREIAVRRRHRGVRGDCLLVGGPGFRHPAKPAIRDTQAVVSLRACRILAQRRIEFSDGLLVTPGL